MASLKAFRGAVQVERGLAVCGTPAATDTAHCVGSAKASSAGLP